MSCNCQNTSNIFTSHHSQNSFGSPKSCHISTDSFGFLGASTSTPTSTITADQPLYVVNHSQSQYTIKIQKWGILTSDNSLIVAKPGYYRLSAQIVITSLSAVPYPTNNILGMIVSSDTAGTNRYIDVRAPMNGNGQSMIYTGERIVSVTSNQSFYLLLSIQGQVSFTIGGTWASLMLIPV